ncbi:trihelix transcription factor asil2 [Phtheirospermum japonicum]|uniref:Trihelix transcription factor asil2 n=1 Tax=Phtheirospermum japonicum TaxID=374723 RepID=A0A830D133_9LAMI|nr:trihelix transcription factor asil2 [Phtheirospermum japonicum]
MSSVTTAVAVAVAVDVDAADEVTVVAETVEKAPRRFPPPCWTQEEALVLIDAYRERWYALRRGYLRTADWDAVAAAVASRCPGASLAKTSAQCRHKMEKLRQRYRAEKQRALSFPSPAGRYFSSWFFFENMEAMENGTTPPTSVEKPDNPSDGSRLNSFIDQSVLKLKLKSKSNPEPSPDLGFDNSVQANRLNPATKIPIEYSSYLDTEIDDKEEDDLNNRGIRYQQMNRIPIPVSIPPLKSRSKKYSKMVNNFDGGAGFRQQMPPPGLRIKKLGSDYNRSNPNEVFFASFPNSNNSDYSSSNKFVDPGLRSKYWSNINPNSDPRSAIHGLKRGRNGLEEIVASIKLLGEGFVKMEKEKMEMAREIEGMRMEMEMKRNQMLLESQKQIVDAFLKGMFEVRKSKKVKSGVGVAPDSTDP